MASSNTLLCALVGVCLLAALAAADDGTLIQTTYGAIQCKLVEEGVIGRNPVARNCLGIPFAAPPLDNLRFSPPVPPQSWSGVRSATNYSAACIQSPNGLAW
tara:strand:+ start:468 stop:773 length:306 start_codon:yes stop_codon:yes gene_type:complete